MNKKTTLLHGSTTRLAAGTVLRCHHRDTRNRVYASSAIEEAIFFGGRFLRYGIGGPGDTIYVHEVALDLATLARDEDGAPESWCAKTGYVVALLSEHDWGDVEHLFGR